MSTRCSGPLLGLAVGDALGIPVESLPRGSFEPVMEMTGGGVLGLAPGQWSDDTSMALCLAESLLECDGFDPADQMERYVRWRRHGHLSSIGEPFGIGGTVDASLRRFMRTGEPFAGSTDPYSAGNGSLMRLAPIPMYYAHDAQLAMDMAAESSRTTHGAAACVDACRYFAGLVWSAMHGASKDELCAPYHTPVPNAFTDKPLQKDIDVVAGGSFLTKPRDAIRGSAYVVESLEAALWAFRSTDSFEKAVLAAVNLGDDADTTAAVCGQLAGAYYGPGAIPACWLDALALRETITSYAAGLCRET